MTATASKPKTKDEQTGVVESDLAHDTENEEQLEVPKPTPPMQIALPGDWDTMADGFGGASPDSSEIRLLGGKMPIEGPIEGSFPKGAEFDIVVRVKVTGVLGQDFTDDWGTVQRTVRRHMARMISVKRAA